MAIKTNVDPDKTFIDYLRMVRSCVLEDFEHKEYPFEELVSELQLPRDIGHNPLFEVMLAVHNNKRKIAVSPELEVSYYNISGTDAQYDLTFNVTELKGELHFYIEYSANYQEASVQRMFGQYVKIMEEAVGLPNQQLKDFDLLSEQERCRILYDFNRTEMSYDHSLLYYELFEQQVRLTPNRIALVAAEEVFTYRQLDEMADYIAGMIQNLCTGRGETVAICMKRSANLIASMLGVMKAGGAYIPLDPGYPAERLQYILQDSGTKLLLTDGQSHMLVRFNGRIVDVTQACQYGILTRLPANCSKNAAYVIYTSGSIGKPKGVEISHRALNNFCMAINRQIPFDETSVILACTTVSFDIFVLETLAPLVHGSRIVLADERQQVDRRALCKLILDQGVNILQMVPARLQALLSTKQVSEL